MWTRTVALIATTAVGWVFASNCGSSGASCVGAEDCACYGNGSCDDGFACRSNVCVNLNDVGVGAGSGAGGGSSGGVDVQACLSCAESNCPSQAMDCKSASGCEDIITCMVGCNKDATCLSKCNANASADANVKSLAYQSCAFTSCVSDCVYSGSSGGTGGGSLAGSGAGGTGGSNPGSGGAAGMGTGGSPVVNLVSGVNWIGITSDAAPPTLGPNGKLGINGVFYAYGDGCSTVHWDSPTRCISGDLCLASATNWGVAIGFDLNNSGDTGMPPNVKHAWNASAVGVTGFAWETHGVLPSPRQVWILNMDPKWSGQCTAAECGINGPPDGNPSTPDKGQLLFSAMMKDDWGGTGTTYQFNPANISAVQFKIPAATISISTQYELCIDRLGVIR